MSAADEAGATVQPAASEEDVSRLLRLAGRRMGVPEAATARVREAARLQWHDMLRARRRRRVVRVVSLIAAAVALALAIGLRLGPGRDRAGVPQAQSVAVRVERSRGAAVRATTAGGAPLILATGVDLVAGTWLETPADGRAALRADGRVSVRLDTGTRVQVLSASSYRLDRGGLYVDTGSETAPANLSVRTAQALVRDIGTQFELRADAGVTRVRVRAGTIVLDGHGEAARAGAGTALDVEHGAITRRAVAIYGPDWAWAEQIAPEFALEGRSLRTFLDWAARETGWTVRIASPDLARSADGIRLHGSAAGLTPSQALEAVLPTCGLALRRQAGTAWIEQIPASRGNR
jgi:ferric-dicitrate binding protein FerR (iron transport regulator)